MSQDRAKIEDLLRDFWEQNAISTDSGDTKSIDDMLVPMDSITACEVLLDIEKLIGKKLPVETIIQKGGYATKNEFVAGVADAVAKQTGESK